MPLANTMNKNVFIAKSSDILKACNLRIKCCISCHFRFRYCHMKATGSVRMNDSVVCEVALVGRQHNGTGHAQGLLTDGGSASAQS